MEKLSTKDTKKEQGTRGIIINWKLLIVGWRMLDGGWARVANARQQS